MLSKTIISLFCVLSIATNLKAQELKTVKVYRTTQDFKDNKFVTTEAYKKDFTPTKETRAEPVARHARFYTADEKRFQNSFAVEREGQLFFQTKFMNKDRAKGDKLLYYLFTISLMSI